MPLIWALLARAAMGVASTMTRGFGAQAIAQRAVRAPAMGLGQSIAAAGRGVRNLAGGRWPSQNGPGAAPTSFSAAFTSQAARHYGTVSPTQAQLQAFHRAQQPAQGVAGFGPLMQHAGAAAKSMLNVAAAGEALNLGMRYLNSQFLETAEQRRAFASPINQAMAQLDRNSLRREIQTSQAMAGTSEARIQAIDRLRTAQQPLTQATGNFANIIGVMGTRIQTAFYDALNNLGLTDGIKAMNKYLAKLLKIKDDEGGAGGVQSDLKRVMRGIADGSYVRRKPGGPGGGGK